MEELYLRARTNGLATPHLDRHTLEYRTLELLHQSLECSRSQKVQSDLMGIIELDNYGYVHARMI